MSEDISQNYGVLNASYLAAGQDKGLEKLSRDFYDIMQSMESAHVIWTMHSEETSILIDKLSLFLAMWLGGPKLYKEKYKVSSMPQAHSHLIIDELHRDQWLKCMDRAIDAQDYVDAFKIYLKTQFRLPAQLIMKTSRSE